MKTYNELLESAKNQISEIAEKSKEAPLHRNSYLSFYEGENGICAPHYVRRDVFLRRDEIAFGSRILNEKTAMQMIEMN